MTILTTIAGFLVIISIFSLLIVITLSFFLGFLLKKYDKETYQSLYVLCLPFSPLSLYGYVRNNSNLDKLPENKKWILKTLKYSLSTLFIAFILACLGVYMNSLAN